MAAVTTTGAGNWSSGSSVFSGGSGVGGVPTNADAVTITHAITLDTAAAVCDTLTINAGGSLVSRTTGDSKLIVDKGITTASNATAVVTLDMSSCPQYKSEIYWNNDNSGTLADAARFKINGDFDLRGAEKTAWCYASGVGASSSIAVGDDGTAGKEITATDATGWRQGDRIVFCTTQTYNATPKVDVLTLSGSYTNGSTDLVFTAGMTYQHDGGCLIGNLTRNVILGPATAGNIGELTFGVSTRATTPYLRDIAFVGAKGSANGNSAAVYFNGANTGLELVRCVFEDFISSGLVFSGAVEAMNRQNNIFYSTRSDAFCMSSANVTRTLGADLDTCIFQAFNGIQLDLVGVNYTRPKISGVTNRCLIPAGPDPRVEGGGVWSSNDVFYFGSGISGQTNAISMRFGRGPDSSHDYSSAANARLAAQAGAMSITITNCLENNTAFISAAPSATSTKMEFFDRNNSPDNQEVYGSMSVTSGTPELSRTTTAAAVSNSTSALRMKWTGTSNKQLKRSFQILSKSGVPLTLIGYFQKSGANDPISGDAAYGSSTLPYVEVSGLGITPVRITMDAGTAAGDWEKFSFLPGTATEVVQSSGGDGLLTVDFVGRSATTGAACYFSGVPLAPFVTRCRHYGYLFDETSPTRTADSTISAAFATADAYTGITITWGTTSTIALGASQTFQKLIDYTAAKAIANVGDALPITWAGVADNAALFAQGNITTTGYTLNGGGSLAMGSKTLTASIPWAYTYTGGTFSQAASVPSFSGGTLNIGAAGTYTYAQAAAMILSMTPTAPGTYALGSATFTGQVDLRNTSGSHAITVELPTGTSYTTANNTGATITVTVPVVTADISITGMANTGGANNRLQVINSSALAASDWQAATVYAAGDVVLRTSGVGSENTAGLYMRCTSGGTSHATTEPTWDTTVGNTTTDNSVTWTTYAVLYYDADPAGTSMTDTYIDGEEFVAGETIEIRFAEEDPGVTFKTYSTSVVATADGFSALVNETADDVYATYAISGAAYEATFSPNYAANYIVLDANTDFSGKSAYAYYCYLLTTSSGMYRFWGGLTGIDAGNIRNNVGTISLYFDESAGFVKQTDDVRIFRSDNTRPAIDPTTGGSGIEINWRTPVSVVSTGGSALTPTESAQLMALPSATTISASVWAYVVTGSTTAVQMMRGFAAMLLGKVSGAGTGTETFRDIADTKDVATFTVDSSGNRTAVTRDLT